MGGVADDRTCAVCGATPPMGWASVTLPKGEVVPLCWIDEDTPSCFDEFDAPKGSMGFYGLPDPGTVPMPPSVARVCLDALQTLAAEDEAKNGDASP